MAVRHQYIDRSPAVVWSVLADENTYGDWVVGTSRSRPAQGSWPRTGATLTYTVRLGRWTAEGRTVVRRHAPPQWLELEAHSGPFGTARIAFDIRPWGDGTLVILDEHPLRGMGGTLHNGAVDALLQLRHRTMLRRLARLVESRPRETPVST